MPTGPSEAEIKEGASLAMSMIHFLLIGWVLRCNNFYRFLYFYFIWNMIRIKPVLTKPNKTLPKKRPNSIN